MPSIVWTLDPPSQDVVASAQATLTDSWLGGVGLSQDFTFSDGGAGGVFSPASQTGVVSPSSFQYSNGNPGVVTITVTPGAGPLFGQTPLTAIVTVEAAAGDGLRHPRLIGLHGMGMRLS